MYSKERLTFSQITLIINILVFIYSQVYAYNKIYSGEGTKEIIAMNYKN